MNAGRFGAPARVDAIARSVDDALRAQAVPERADREKAYLKSALMHYGTSVPAIRSTVKACRATIATLSHDELLALVEHLWSSPVHEHHVAAIEVLALFADQLEPDDIACIEAMLRTSYTWAYVDGLSTTVTGRLVERHPRLTDVLDRWSADDDFWVRRASMLALLVPLRRGDGDFERFSRYADAMLDEKEFFIRKAIGWVLRDTAKRRPDLVYDWLLPRAARASGVTLREALKPLSEQQRAGIQAAARANRR